MTDHGEQQAKPASDDTEGRAETARTMDGRVVALALAALVILLVLGMLFLHSD